jgi:DNA-binding winged helix-turn-helix (wHTH) protein/TolB-like protein/tetratricopeptide (TPR) repeat protein
MNEPQTQIYEFGDFRIDAAKRLLTKGNDEPLALTPKVFDTLLYLVRHHGKVIEKDQLMRDIWTDTIVEENNLSQNISILRRTLGEKPGEGRFIATIPGHGFRFVAEVRAIADLGWRMADFKAEEAAIETGSAQTGDRPANDFGRETKERASKRVRFALFAVLTALLLGAIGFYFWRGGEKIKSADARIKSIAVLPFRSLVAENRDEALEVGMADTLISRLGNNREVVVRPLSAVRKFDNPEQDALTAGRALDVEAVLDGSVQRWGDKIRVNVRLVKVTDGTLLWTGTFDEKFTDIFVVQDAISSKVAAALFWQLGGDEKMRLTKRYTENVEAYQLYLKGRYQVYKFTLPEINKGIAYFRQAIDLDPNYTLAYVGLADAYRAAVLSADAPPAELLKAKAAAQKAIELDDALADAHRILGAALFFYDWNWKDAENQYQRALGLDPNSADTHWAYALLLSNTLRHAEALSEIKRARELDPLNLMISSCEGLFLTTAGKPDEALVSLQKTLELDPDFWPTHLGISSAYIQKGMFAEAIAEAQKAKEFNGDNVIFDANIGYALAKSGKTSEARAVLNKLLKASTEHYVPPSSIAFVYNGLGERDETLNWLERGVDARDTDSVFLKAAPGWNNLRSEPRFIALIKRMNFE